jgi:hypothetical protein
LWTVASSFNPALCMRGGRNEVELSRNSGRVIFWHIQHIAVACYSEQNAIKWGHDYSIK